MPAPALRIFGKTNIAAAFSPNDFASARFAYNRSSTAAARVSISNLDAAWLQGLTRLTAKKQITPIRLLQMVMTIRRVMNGGMIHRLVKFADRLLDLKESN